MPTATRAAARRSQRTTLCVSVHVFEVDSKEKFLVEETFAVSVNLHGGLILLATNVEKGQRFRIRTRSNQQTKEFGVVYLGPYRQSKRLVGIEFTEPAPDFWGMSFPELRLKVTRR